MTKDIKNENAIDWVDPLYKVFEHFLFTRTYEDSSAFTKEVANQYLAYLDSTAGFIPCHVRKAIEEDLETEIHEMLVKKIYGFQEAPETAPLHGIFSIGQSANTNDGGDEPL